MFRNCAYVSDDHQYGLDSTLMFMSKGGITVDWCGKYGVKTKEKYLTQLQSIYQNAYGSPDSGSGGKTLDGSGTDPGLISDL